MDGAGRTNPPHVPLHACVLFCDDERLPDPLYVAEAILAEKIPLTVIVRSRNTARRGALAQAFKRLSRETPILSLLIAGDMALARGLGCGLHLPQNRMGETRHWRAISPQPVTVATHSATAVFRAARFGASAAFLSPIFPTKSHPGAPALGPLRAGMIAREAPLPLWMLGGITPQNARRLTGISGIAGISLWEKCADAHNTTIDCRE